MNINKHNITTYLSKYNKSLQKWEERNINKIIFIKKKKKPFHLG